jgi:trehalose 6-phosphate synthase/phosphatase
MFRALNLFPTGVTKAVLDPPLAITCVNNGTENKPHPVELAIKPDAIFTTAVGHSSKRTLASWHVTTPAEIVEHMLHIVAFDDAP